MQPTVPGVKQLYSLLFYAFAPFLLFRLFWKSRRIPAYRERISERFGVYLAPPRARSPIWIHAVSVGECEAAFPIIRILLRQGGARLLITCTTPTGSARIREVLGDQVEHVYLPYDLPGAVGRFISHFRPRLGLIMETEIWPNLFLASAKHGIPLAILNARLSEKSARGYKKLPGLVGLSLQQVTQIAAQTRADAERFLRIGAPGDRISVMGNIKFAIRFEDELRKQSADLRRSLFPGRKVWIAGSTHPGEETQILDALTQVRSVVPDVVLILVPRHPERSPDVRRLCEGRGLIVQTRSEGLGCASHTPVFLIDGIGELRLFYGTADVAFVGGSLIPHGGQNILEAAATGIPVLFGPHMMNFAEIARNFLASGSGVQVDAAASLAGWVLKLLQAPDLAADYGAKGRAFIEENRGALDQTLSLIDDLLAGTSAGTSGTQTHA